MGNLTIAVCSCGFESEHLCCGGGELNFKTICDAPVICGDCGAVKTTNLLDDGGGLKALDSLRCLHSLGGTGSGCNLDDSVAKLARRN